MRNSRKKMKRRKEEINTDEGEGMEEKIENEN